MKSKFVAATIVVSSLFSSGLWAQEINVLESELAAITSQLDQIDALSVQYEGGLILSLIESRRQALLLSQSLIENRISAERGEAQIEIIVPAVQPNLTRAAELLAEIANYETRILQTEQEVSQVGGLVQALALSRLETEKLTLAQLQMAYYQANYGIAVPLTDVVERTAIAPANAISTSSPEEVAEGAFEWADSRYPDVDYSLQPFAVAFREGEQISGWWAIATEVAVIDDSTSVIAMNYSAYEPDSYGGLTVLMARCAEGETALIMVQDEYLSSDYRSNGLPTAYRIDQLPTVESRWSTLVSNQGVGLFGREAENFIRRIYDAERLFIRVTDSRGRRVDTQFDLSGGADAFDRVAAACGWTTLELSPDDYMAIQTLLEAGGYDVGIPDGVWGPTSRRAMSEYQADQGLQETGAPDRATLETMGL